MLIPRLRENSEERRFAAIARAACDRIHDIVRRMHHITRIEYLIDPSQTLPPPSDIRKSSQESDEGHAVSPREQHRHR